MVRKDGVFFDFAEAVIFAVLVDDQVVSNLIKIGPQVIDLEISLLQVSRQAKKYLANNIVSLRNIPTNPQRIFKNRR